MFVRVKQKCLPNEVYIDVFLGAAIFFTRMITFEGCLESQAACGGSSSPGRTGGVDYSGAGTTDWVISVQGWLNKSEKELCRGLC